MTTPRTKVLAAMQLTNSSGWSRFLVIAGIVGVAAWGLVSTRAFLDVQDPPARPPAEEAPVHRGSGGRVSVGSLAEVRAEVGEVLGNVLVLTAGRPRTVFTYAGDRGLFAETVYRLGHHRVVLRQSTTAPPGARLLLAYVEDVPGTAQSPSDYYWADRGYVLSLSRTGAHVAGKVRWQRAAPDQRTDR
jgi:hypothetical protein